MSHHQCTSTLVKTKCIPHCLCCSAKQADSIVVSLQRLSSINRRAMPHHQCTSALVRAKCIPHRLCCSAKQADNIVESLQRHLWICLQHTGVQCPSFNALQHCSRQNAFLTAYVALQNRLTAVLCHCKDTFGYFFNTQLCNVLSPMQYCTGQGKSHSALPRVTLQNKLTAGLCHCK